MIKIKNISKTYNKGATKVEALKNISISIENGELIALMGASGSGKSTLLQVIGGLDKCDSGSIFINEEDISALNLQKLADFRRDDIGFVFQQFHLIPTLTVIENIMLPQLPMKMKKTDSYQDAKAVLDKVGLIDRENHLPGELSGGEQQRVAIARALINKPKIILADEPTGDLDSKIGEKIIGLLTNLNKEEKVTVIIATHDDKIAEKARRKIVLKDGKVIRDINGNT